MRLATAVDASKLTAFTARFGQVLGQPVRHGGIRAAAGEAMGDYLAAMRARFSAAAGGGGDWADLAPSTKLARLRKAGMRYPRQKGVTRADRLRSAAGVHLPILMDTLRLFESLTPGAPGSFVAYGLDRLSAGTSVPYGRFHQDGGNIPGRPPRRPILVTPDAALLDRMGTPIHAAVASMSQALVRQAIAA